MLAVQNPRRWWNFSMSEGDKKEIEPVTTK